MFVLKNYQPIIDAHHLVLIPFRGELTEALSDWVIGPMSQGWPNHNRSRAKIQVSSILAVCFPVQNNASN